MSPSLRSAGNMSSRRSSRVRPPAASARRVRAQKQRPTPAATGPEERHVPHAAQARGAHPTRVCRDRTASTPRGARVRTARRPLSPARPSATSWCRA
eukprot:6822608-Prymnesium_polylepis.1